MRDKYTAGVLSGFFAGLSCPFLQFVLSGVLGLGRLPIKEFPGMAIFLRVPRTLAETAVSILAHLGFCSFMGGVFAYFLELVSDRHDLAKGVQFGLGISGAIWVATALFRLRPDNISTTGSFLVDLASAAAYGLVLALLYRVFHHRE